VAAAGRSRRCELIAPQVDELGAMKPQDGLMLAALCEIAATYSGAVVELCAQGRLLTNPRTGCVQRNPWCRWWRLRAGIRCGLRGRSRSRRWPRRLLGKLPTGDNDEDDPIASAGKS
jgi:hypothetical protein